MTTKTFGRSLRFDQGIRDLAPALAAEYPRTICFYGMCDHDHTSAPVTPAGVVPLPLGTMATHVHPADQANSVVLVRFTRREWGGWYVVRADNRRILGWVVKHTTGEFAGRWVAYTDAQAFKGKGIDDTGHVLDRVPTDLYNGDPSDPIRSRSIGYDTTREGAAWWIASRLIEKRATALGYGPHRDVTPYHTRSAQHIEFDPVRRGRRSTCSCGHAWPCPERAEQAAAEAADR